MAAEIEEGGWIELSHPIDADVAKVPFLPAPETKHIDDASLQATEVCIATHVGTHLEAPRHLYEDGRPIDDYPATRWISRGVVCEVDADRLDRIDVGQLNPPAPIASGDAVLLRTGWEERVGDDSYYEQPYLSKGATEWLVERGVSWVGVDSPSPEQPVQLRDESFDYPVHSTLLDNDIPIAEHLTNLASATGAVLDVIALPIRYHDSDGAQARIVARPR